MFGTLALAAAILFVVFAIARLRGSPQAVLGTGALAAAALAAVFAVLHWMNLGDSRWLVGGALMAGALVLSLVKGNRTVTIGAIVLGVLGTALFGIAFASPMRVPVVAMP